MKNAIGMMLFPPFGSQPLGKGVLPGCDGYFPLFSQLGTNPVFAELLTLQSIFVCINTLIAWLVLQKKRRQAARSEFKYASAIGWFAAGGTAARGIYAAPKKAGDEHAI